ncbi:hypothetical protein N8Y98_02880 [Pelagibacterales bacterium]|nr:hypothetical protein [Pelagibacterales bacterium]
MQDEDKTIDVGEANEEAQEIDLDAPAPEQSLEEEQIDVEQVSEDSVKSEDAPAESTEQSNVQADKEELGEYSEGVKKRIAKLTRKMREAERQKEEAIAYAQQVNEQAKNMRGQYDQLGDNYTKELEAKVATGMDAAKLAYRQAVENQDIDGQVAAQQALAKMAIEEQRLANIKVGQEQKLAQTTQPTTQPVAQPQQYQQPQAPVDPQADAWATKNAWFGTDNAMTYTAFDIHKALVEEEGYDPQSTEYYAEVDKRIRVAFPNKFANVEESTPAPVQNVASAKRPATSKGRRKTVKLTPSQVAISKRLGVPLEEYAKHLAAKEV